MAKLYNRAKMTTATTGTGTITLGSAVSGYQSFASAGVQNGDVVSYVIEDNNGNVEFGTGTYTSAGTTLSRTVTQASISGTWGTTAITLSGTANVFIAPLAADLVDGTGGDNDHTFIVNDQTVTANYTVASGKNAGSFGPVTINPGITVTVSSGSVWSIV